MTVERVKGGIVEVELLRPATDFKRYKPGDRLPIFLAEIGEPDGTATIHSIMPCQTPADGHGNVVTGRFKTRLASGINQVWLSNRDSFAGTASHPIWVCNRKEFVRLVELQVGDRLDTLDGTSEVVRIESLSVPQDVYNIEVDSEHVYRIGSTGVLVHNVGDDDCPLVNIGDAARSVNGRKIINSDLANTIRQTVGGPVQFDADGFPDFTPYSIRTVRVDGLTGKMADDISAALKAAGMDSYDDVNFVWHHHQDGRSMMLVPRNVHSVRNGGVGHTGGRAVIQHNLANPNNPIRFPSPPEL